MEWWMVILLTYGPGSGWEEYQSAVVLPPTVCEQALRVGSEPFLELYPEGMVQCVELQVPYSSPRPKARPQGGN